MDMRIAFVLAVGLAGCASTLTETVYLERVSQGGMGQTQTEKAACGPYPVLYYHPALAQESLRECIEDFQRQGFERVQGPE